MNCGDSMNEIDIQAFQHAISGDFSSPYSKAGEAFWERGPDETPAFSPTRLASHPQIVEPYTPKRKFDPITPSYNRIAELDWTAHSYRREIVEQLERLSYGGRTIELDVITRLKSYAGRLRSHAEEIGALDVGQYGPSVDYKQKVTTNFINWAASLDDTVELVNKRAICDESSALAVDMQQGSYIFFWLAMSSDFFSERFTHTVLATKEPRMLFAAFIVIVLSVFGKLTNVWSNTALKLIELLLGIVLGNGNPEACAPLDKKHLEQFPLDIRTAREIFDIEADLEIWAACPSCHTTYPPPEYPLKCTATRFGNTRQCGARVCKSKVGTKAQKGTSVLFPIKPYAIQNFHTFKASLLSRPGVEEMLDRGTTFLQQSSKLFHLRDGSAVLKMKGPDQKPFLDGLKRTELRLLWTFSVDWFNPYTNKAAGKSASIGSIALTCINLPPSLQYDSSYMYLAGIIPGPNEPPEDACNHYILPIARALNRAWKNGTFYSSTPLHPNGRFERSAVATGIFDMPGARKVGAQASHSSDNHFCNLCILPRKDINNIVVDTWTRKDRDTLKSQAEQWRDAPSRKEQKRLFAKNGVRWSALWELEYFDPTTMIVVDTMHNLFLGLVHYHFRHVIGVSEEDLAQEPIKLPTAEELAKATLLLRKPGASQSQLQQIRVPTLKTLCEKYNLYSHLMSRTRKKDMISELQVRSV